MQPVFFSSAKKFRSWLEKHHDKKEELLVGYYKVGTGKLSMSWSESVDEALCFGWIDGVRRSVDEERYTIRFTPRRAGSIWSAINMKKMEELTAQGKMTEAGLKVYEKRQEKKSAIYSYEKAPAELSKDYEKRFRANAKAWTWFGKTAPSYQRTAIHWVMSARQESTREKRIETLIRDSANEEKIKPLSYGENKKPVKKAKD